MNTEKEKQFILVNFYDGELAIGHWDPDSPEFIELKEYEGEDISTMDGYGEVLKLRGYDINGNKISESVEEIIKKFISSCDALKAYYLFCRFSNYFKISLTRQIIGYGIPPDKDDVVVDDETFKMLKAITILLMEIKDIAESNPVEVSNAAIENHLIENSDLSDNGDEWPF